VKKPIVVVSSCLNSEKVRYNGQDVPSKIVSDLAPFVEYIKVCPETAIGLGVPREPIRIVKVGEELRLIQHTTDRDVTDDMNAYSKRFLESLDEVDGFIFKSRSPTMGLKDIRVYSGIAKGSSVIERCSGFFAGAAAEKYPGFPLEDEGRLMNKKIREHFLTRLFLFANYREAEKNGNLRDFHEANTILFRFYDDEAAQKLDYSATDYFELIRQNVRKPPGSEQIYSFFRTFENSVSKKNEYQVLMEKYRLNKVSFDTLKEVLGLLVTDEEILRSSFFNPFPLELKEDAEHNRDEDYWS
jgi:uncharacterized protein YbbK (DUF523 family)/uncharacterized protein YbgA (DUF1722 family)